MNTVPDAFEARGPSIGGEFILYVDDTLDGADTGISRNWSPKTLCNKTLCAGTA